MNQARLPQLKLQTDSDALQEPYKGTESTASTPTADKSPYGDEKSPRLRPDSHLEETSYSTGSQSQNNRPNKSHEGLLRLIGSFLDELHRRPVPPSVFDAWINDGPLRTDRNTKVLAATLRGVAAFQAGKRDVTQRTLSVPDTSDDEDEKEKPDFSTDITAAILTRLRSSLLELERNGWQLDISVSGSNLGSSSEKAHTPFRSRRRSLRPIGRRSRSPSPAAGVNARPYNALNDCLIILSSVVLEDCRFQTPVPGPARPPNALQSIILDIALILCKMYRNDPQILSRIGMALLPAFATFKAEMHSRLLAVFNDWILRDMLDDLRRTQGAGSSFSEDIHDNSLDLPKGSSISIHVEGAQDDEEEQRQPAWVPWTKPGLSVRGIPSTNSPNQSLQIYFLSSLVQPLVAAIGENIVDTAPPSTMFRLYRLIDALTDLKRDACLDILNVAAYSPPRARYFALSLLTTLWPKAIGHTFVSKAFPVMTSSEATHTGEGRSTHDHAQSNHSQPHQFMLWNFRDSSSVPAESSPGFKCRSCSTLLRGFGLLCPFCMCGVHFDCYDYPEGSHLSEYTLSEGANLQKVAVYRFCNLVSTKPEGVSGEVSVEGHLFGLVNIFTLCLCFMCRKPLWGLSAQGLKCARCNLFAHCSCIRRHADVAIPHCQSMTMDATHVSLGWMDLRDSFKDHYRQVLTLLNNRTRLTYEELSILHSTFWTQLQIMNNGLILGSVVVKRRNGTAIIASMKENELDEFEIHTAARSVESLLSSNTPTPSPALQEYFLSNRISSAEHSIFYDWPTLTYITSVLKASDDTWSSPTASFGLLSVAGPEAENELKTSFQTTSMGRIRDALGRGLSVYSDDVARIFLCHMYESGLFERADRTEHLFNNGEDPALIECSFALPFGLDESADVEHIVASVESCLCDLDLSVNEAGFLLLVRRLWPNEMTSDYARVRLCGSIITWILAEDENLASILRDYVARGRPLPGVRSRLEGRSWPSPHDPRHTPQSSTNNGGDYVACRRALLHQYATGWLLALHNLDMNAYACVIYDICAEFAHDNSPEDIMTQDRAATDRGGELAHHDDCLRLIIKLAQASVTFAIPEDLILLWLQHVPAECRPTKPLPTILRLFNREGDGTHRYSSVADPSVLANSALTGLDPWSIVMGVAKQKDQFRQSLHWLSFLAAAGVDVPVHVYSQFSSFVSQYTASLEDSVTLAQAALESTWLKSLGHQRLQGMIVDLHSLLAKGLIQRMRTCTSMPLVCSFIRYSLSVCLLLFGCERKSLLSCGLVKDEEVRHLPSRRKLNARASAMVDPIIVDARLINCLRGYVECAVEEVSIIIAKFLDMLVKEAALLESYEVDNFILKNEEALCLCAWKFYELQSHDIANARTSFLLRVLVVDTQPFRAILQHVFEESGNWESRFQAVACLFRMILDVTSPSFMVEDRQFRSSFIDVFHYYFRALWADEKEEIRLTVDTWSKTLLPVHFDAIATCWNEALPKIPVGQRVELIAFLVQLRPHFPEWQVLSWDVIVEMILEDDYLQKNGNNEDGPASAHLSMYGLSSRDSTFINADTDPDMSLVRVAIVLLSLQMIANGIAVDIAALLRIKTQLLKILGFADVSLIPALSGHAFHVRFGDFIEIPESALPCISELPALFDAFHPFDLAPSAMGGPYSHEETPANLLVGSAFVDVLLALVVKQDFSNMPVGTARHLMEALLIVIYKHDFDSRPLRHLMPDLRHAVRHVMDVLLMDVAYELRRLSVSICNAYIKCWGVTSTHILVDSIEIAAKAIELLNHNGEDALVIQIRSFIETTLTMRARGGIFNALCKQPLDTNFLRVLRDITDANAKTVRNEETLREVLLFDTLGRAHENDRRHLQVVVNNLNRYVEIVHHEDCTSELMYQVGQFLGNITRRLAEAPDAYDPSPMFLLAATLIEHNRARSHELLRATGFVLTACLPRFSISSESLLRLMRVSMRIYGRPSQPGQRLGDANGIIGSILGTLSDGLRGRGRVTPQTLTSILEILSLADAFDGRSGRSLFSDYIMGIAEDALHYLSSSPASTVYSDAGFACARAAARMIMETTEDNAEPFLKQVTAPSDKTGRQPLSIRSWNVLLVTALCTDLKASSRLLLDNFPTFLVMYHRCLKSYHIAEPGTIGLTGADVNYAYISIKLWLLLAHRVSSIREETGAASSNKEDATSRMLWNDLWPPFEHLLAAFEEDAQLGSVPATGALILSSIADLFMFLHQSRSVVMLDTALNVEVLTRARALAKNETLANKLSRVLRTMSEPAEDISTEVLVKQVVADLVATEKLQALEVRRRDAGKAAYEKKPERR